MKERNRYSREVRYSLAQVRVLKPDVVDRGVSNEPNGFISNTRVEMERAGFTMQEILLEEKKADRIEELLKVGREAVICPCNKCPNFNLNSLCKKGVLLSQDGSLNCPEERGKILILK